MRVLLPGAIWLHAEAIKLYQADDVGQIATTRAKAMKALGPGASFVGVGGSPSWTLAAEAGALTLVSGFLAGVAAKQAAEQLQQVQTATELMLREMGAFFEVSNITNVALPYPTSWSAMREGSKHIHSGDEFVWVRTADQGDVCVRWAKVVAIA